MDAAMQAAQTANQMATQAAQTANQMAMQAAQTANQMAMQASQQASQDAMNAMQMASDEAFAYPCCGATPVAAPKFSVPGGAFTAPVTVTISERSRGAAIHYTTDGWTPTMASPHYLGPITLASTATLQAIAFAPNGSRSQVTSASYTFPAAQPAPTSAALHVLPRGKDDFVLQVSTPVPLLFASALDSNTAHVGDAVPFVLAEDLLAGNTVLLPKGTPGTGRVVQANPSASRGRPGEIAFRVDALNLDGVRIPLHATEALEGKPESSRKRGEEASIEAGTPVTATIPAGTLLAGPAS